MSRQGICIIFMCSIIIISFTKLLTTILHNTGSLGRSTPTGGLKPSLLPHSQYICCKYIIKSGENPEPQDFINCFYVIKVKILINFWHFLLVFLMYTYQASAIEIGYVVLPVLSFLLFLYQKKLSFQAAFAFGQVLAKTPQNGLFQKKSKQ